MKERKLTVMSYKDHSCCSDLVWLTVMTVIIVITVLSATIAGLV